MSEIKQVIVVVPSDGVDQVPYAGADAWVVNDDSSLSLRTPSGKGIATWARGTWQRVEITEVAAK